MPLRRDMLLTSNLMGPSLESLPIELHLKIADMLSRQELQCLSICSKKLHEFYSEVLKKKSFPVNKNMLFKDSCTKYKYKYI